MFLVSVTWLNAYAMVAYGLSKVPGLVSEPSVDTTSNAEVSITLSSKLAGPGAVIVTVPSLAGVNSLTPSLFAMVTLAGLRAPELAVNSMVYSGIVPSRVRFSVPSVPTNCAKMSAVVPMYTVSEPVDNSIMVQFWYNEELTRVVLGFSLLPQKL